MTIQWVLIASFLYLELGLTVLLVLPFISSRIWKRVVHFPLWETIERKANMYFTVFIVVLVLFFLDSIREMIKYSGKHPIDNTADIQVHMKLFRSQRNYYIVGFSIFMSLVIRRLILLLVKEADLLNKNEEAMKEAQEAAETLQKLSRESTEAGQSNSKALNEILLKEIEKLEKELGNKSDVLNSAKQSRETILERCKESSRECENLQERINILNGSISTSIDDELD